MKAVILAGGFGTRLSEETELKPKPMIEIGGKPMLWHIMKIYSFHGISDFIICCGYKGYIIKEYFANYFLHQSDVTFDIRNNKMTVHQNSAEPWNVTLIDTGLSTMTGGRLKRVHEYIKDDDIFCFTYGDGVCDIDITALIGFHKKHGKQATLTAVTPQGRFGALQLEDESVIQFKEKPNDDGSKINGGFFVLSTEIFKLIDDDDCTWEQSPLKSLAENGELMAFEHNGFWQPMDTLRDKNYLEDLWSTDNAPWKVW